MNLKVRFSFQKAHVMVYEVSSKEAWDVFLLIKRKQIVPTKYRRIKFELPENLPADKPGFKFKDTFHA